MKTHKKLLTKKYKIRYTKFIKKRKTKGGNKNEKKWRDNANSIDNYSNNIGNFNSTNNRFCGGWKIIWEF